MNKHPTPEYNVPTKRPSKLEYLTIGTRVLYYTNEYFHSGRDYNIPLLDKTKILAKLINNTRHIPTATSWLYHIILATEIMNIPKIVKGDIIECGCWKGGSSTNLSIVCNTVGRKLIICDSFEGLPKDELESHRYPHLNIDYKCNSGLYKGTLDEVVSNIVDYGVHKACVFKPGWFKDTLPTLKDPVAFVFLDVDLTESQRDCIKYLWPLLIENGRIYTDDACDVDMYKMWFDDSLFNGKAPGLVGTGCGLPVYGHYSSLGYAMKETRQR